MLRRIAALTGMSAAALLATTPAATAAPADDGVGLTYGITTAVIDMSTGIADGAFLMTSLDEG